MSSLLTDARNAAHGSALSPIMSLPGKCGARNFEHETLTANDRFDQRTPASSRTSLAAWRVSLKNWRVLSSQVTAERTASPFATSGRRVSSGYSSYSPDVPSH
jgi:hypothetical protein